MERAYYFIRKMIWSFMLCAFTNTVNADRIQYTYDASGNRVQAERQILLRETGADSDNDSRPLRHEINNHSITICPNPTEGRFSVEITGFELVEKSSITIYNMTGSIVYFNSQPDALNEIDLTICPRGMYLMVIRLDAGTSSWKIIKI